MSPLSAPVSYTIQISNVGWRKKREMSKIFAEMGSQLQLFALLQILSSTSDFHDIHLWENKSLKAYRRPRLRWGIIFGVF
jgi:hypothetical protein